MLELLLPELVIAIFALAVIFIDMTLREDDKEFLGYLSLLGLVVALALVLMQAKSAYTSQLLDAGVLSDLIRLDLFAIFFKLVFLLVALLVVLGSLDATRKDRYKGEYYSLMLLSTLGMMFAAMAVDLVLIFVAVELASIATFALAAYRKNRRTTEAAMKYFVIGAFSSGLIVFGMSLLYGLSGSTNLYEIATALPGAGELYWVMVLGVVFLIAGFGYKVAAVPFHMWAPDTYHGAASPVSAFLAAATKKMAFVALLRIFVVGLSTPALLQDWALLFGVLAAVTMTLGNVVALAQRNIKRMLAYSSIGQAGYVLIIFALLASEADVSLSVGAGLLHILTHAIMKGGAFLAVAAASYYAIGSELEDFSNLGRRLPLTALAMTIFLLSLAGIPFFAGFVSKFMILTASVAAGGFYLFLGILLVINSVVSLYYYARVIRYMYFSDREVKREREPRLLAAALLIAAFLVVYIGVFPDAFVSLSLSAASSLFS
ncbi:MAG: NADH-quinone oxidoreductase subunit N [Euryarchaeota archaeon]|nr:NADH-quinone oxidoreductase subunit N [Euryarchaeota archaeon]